MGHEHLDEPSVVHSASSTSWWRAFRLRIREAKDELERSHLCPRRQPSSRRPLIVSRCVSEVAFTVDRPRANFSVRNRRLDLVQQVGRLLRRDGDHDYFFPLLGVWASALAAAVLAAFGLFGFASTLLAAVAAFGPVVFVFLAMFSTMFLVDGSGRCKCGPNDQPARPFSNDRVEVRAVKAPIRSPASQPAGD